MKWRRGVLLSGISTSCSIIKAIFLASIKFAFEKAEKFTEYLFERYLHLNLMRPDSLEIETDPRAAF